MVVASWHFCHRDLRCLEYIPFAIVGRVLNNVFLSVRYLLQIGHYVYVGHSWCREGRVVLLWSVFLQVLQSGLQFLFHVKDHFHSSCWSLRKTSLIPHPTSFAPPAITRSKRPIQPVFDLLDCASPTESSVVPISQPLDHAWF